MASFRNPEPPTVDDINDALEDFGFHHPFQDVARMYAEYCNNGNYGYGAGVMHQPDEYWEDIATMYWLSLWDEHVKGIPRLEPVSVFDTLRNTGSLNGKLQKSNG